MADEDQVDEGNNDNLKDLRKAADEGRKARDEAERLKRELAFAKAGIDVDSAVGKMMFKAYDGELDKDTLTTAAREVGAIKDAPAAPDEPNETERAQTRERADLAHDSGTPSLANSGDPFRNAEEAFKEAVRNGDRRDLAFGAAMTEILEAHRNGDPRVIPQPRRGG